MNDKYEDLIPFVEKYKEENLAVKTRRTNWNESVKTLISSTFTDFIKSFELPCYVSEDTNMINHEAVYLAFRDQETGIINKANNQMIFQSGGGLMYHQNANGKISVTFIAPYIEGIKGQKGNKEDIGTFDPIELDEDTIISHILTFLKEILEWECFYRQTIGFHR